MSGQESKLAIIAREIDEFNTLAGQPQESIRRALRDASDATVYHVASRMDSHQAIRENAWPELDRRLHDADHHIPLAVILAIASPLVESTLEDEKDQKFQQDIFAAIARSVSFEPQEAVADALLENIGRQLDENTYILDIALSYRDDMEEIAKLMIERVGTRRISPSFVRKSMDRKIIEAKLIQQERK